jgi:hypothetical protein
MAFKTLLSLLPLLTYVKVVHCKKVYYLLVTLEPRLLFLKYFRKWRTLFLH